VLLRDARHAAKRHGHHNEREIDIVQFPPLLEGDPSNRALGSLMVFTLSKIVSVFLKRRIGHTHWNGRAFFGVYV
jgi:hypothetical protein